VWIGTRRSGDSARASSAAPAAATSTATGKPAPYVRRIDAETRQKLVYAIHEAQKREAAASAPMHAGGSPSSSTSPRPELPAGQDLDKDYIRSCVKELIPLLAECYEQGLERDPKLAGSVVVDFTIDGAPDVGGVVSESAIDDDSTLGDATVRECIQQTMYSLEISAPQDGGQVHVKYPFTFRPAPP
jgi:hypothetical protein